MSKFKDGMPIKISFAKNLRPDGEMTCVRIKQGDDEIQLTRNQTESLINALKERFELGIKVERI